MVCTGNFERLAHKCVDSCDNYKYNNNEGNDNGNTKNRGNDCANEDRYEFSLLLDIKGLEIDDECNETEKSNEPRKSHYDVLVKITCE